MDALKPQDPARTGTHTLLARLGASGSATGRSGAPAYTGDNIDPQFRKPSTGECQLPDAERAPDGFEGSEADPDDPGKGGEHPVFDNKLQLGFWNKGCTVTTKGPGSQAPLLRDRQREAAARHRPEHR